MKEEIDKFSHVLYRKAMKAFTELYTALDATTKANVKIKALVQYFQQVPPEDAIWAIQLLIGKRPKRLISTEKLREWALEMADIPAWLFEESWNTVGDLIETIALVLPLSEHISDIPLHVWIEQKFLPLREQDEATQKEEIMSAWRQMDPQQRFVWNKLLTGGFRVSVSEKIVAKALAAYCSVDETVIAYRLQRHWKPIPEYYQTLVASDTSDADMSQPYPLHLAYPLDDNIEDLGDVNEWHVEWKWDGLRAQIVKREDEVFIWSRDKDLMTDRFPELQDMGMALPNGIVIDGAIVPWRENTPLNVAELQKRMRRKHVSKTILQEVPVRFIAFDLLEYHGQDIRKNGFSWRKKQLSSLTSEISDPRLQLSLEVKAFSWAEFATIREDARRRGVEGLMIKRLDSPYCVGRKRGDWWKWNFDPLTVNAVLMYAQRGQRQHANLYTDYTFAVWDGETFVPFARACSGLTDAEVQEVDRFIKQNTVERFGPVRSVKPELVFEIAFEGIQQSTRHKSGVAVRSPRISRWRRDKKKEDADTLETIQALICDEK